MDIRLYRTEVQNYIKVIWESDDPKDRIAACDWLLKYGENNQENFLIGYAYFSRGETYYALNDMPKFYHDMLSAVPALEMAKEWYYVIIANNMLGIMSLNRGNAPFAMDYYIRAMNCAQEHDVMELAWIVHMNMGALYLGIEDYDHAVAHLSRGYEYIQSHKEMDGYAENLAAACSNLGKTYLAMYQTEEANRLAKQLEQECIPFLSAEQKISVYCFLARLYHEENRVDELNAILNKISNISIDNIAVMDLFDDFYEYLDMLIIIRKTEEFRIIWEKLYGLVKKTSVLNLRRKMLELKIRFAKELDDSQYSFELLEEYTDVTMAMDRENKLMLSNNIAIRNSLQDLTTINHQVEAENERLQKKSETDALTGMANRYRMNTYLEAAFQSAYQKRQPIAIEILDIDYFKKINDTYGHQVGDDYIIKIAECLQGLRLHGNVFCARYGGDEFVIIYMNYQEDEVLKIANELKRSVEKKALPHPEDAGNVVTISQGICWGIPSGYQKAWDYLRAADNNLYQVKQDSRNGIRIGTNEE